MDRWLTEIFHFGEGDGSWGRSVVVQESVIVGCKRDEPGTRIRK